MAKPPKCVDCQEPAAYFVKDWGWGYNNTKSYHCAEHARAIAAEGARDDYPVYFTPVELMENADGNPLFEPAPSGPDQRRP